GPAGLTAAYFLRKQGHNVTIFEQMPKMGGMLRYGIPEYRLPKAVLDKEIKLIEDMGVTLKNNVNIGKDITFEEIKNEFDATLIAIGAWNSSKMRVQGEDLDGVWGGIDFLREVALGNKPEIGKNVAVCGGGNTAMDACRVAVRLGAENVYIIYRRTKDEMPADPQEILESEEEGVIYKYLTNPIEFTGENGKLNGVILQKMMLGEPDESGRRSPVAIEGETEEIKLDSVIMAIGQYPNLNGFETLESTRRNTISADESRFTTSVDGVFAVGDATNKGADIAIAAIGEAQKASVVIDRYLKGETVGYKKPYFVEQNSKDIDYSRFEKVARAKMPHMSPADRKTNFKEVNFGFTEEMAKKEANRCLECGCHDYFECKLISYANDYDVKPSRFAGEKHNRNQENANDLIARNTDKCILCGLCVRVCEEVMGKSAIGLINRGFNTYVEPELGKHLKETECIACGQCVALCPTGALREKTSFAKSVPVKENSVKSICINCSNLCSVDYRYIGSTVTRALPVDNGILCKGGRFSVLNEQNNTTDFDALLNSDTIVISGKTSTETAFVLKKYAEENSKDIFTTAKETDANYYAISKLNIPQYNGKCENAVETPSYYENGTFFDKYGNKRVQNAIFKSKNFADYVNSKLNKPYSDLTSEAEKAVNATPTGKVTNEEIINASKLFVQK
ncbi:MAG: FAD-dependent oxidoreductase, partial [Clostridia bacterium]|nr:FAD-dependent oxidoreductase [Clostridia bacterium]